jgi:hypothetical protein
MGNLVYAKIYNYSSTLARMGSESYHHLVALKLEMLNCVSTVPTTRCCCHTVYLLIQMGAPGHDERDLSHITDSEMGRN